MRNAVFIMKCLGPTVISRRSIYIATQWGKYHDNLCPENRAMPASRLTTMYSETILRRWSELYYKYVTGSAKTRHVRTW